MENNEVNNKDMKELQDKFAMLVQTGRIDNLIDVLAVVSDNISMMTPGMVEKLVASMDNIMSAGFITENAVRYAKREIDKEPVPSLFGMLKLLNDEETRKGLAFVLKLTKGLGKQL